MEIHEIAAQFCLKGSIISSSSHGNGHINNTYRVKTDAGGDYILQRINQYVFKKPCEVMSNISKILTHLSTKTSDPRGMLRLIPTLDGENYLIDDEKEYWRVYDFIGGSKCYDVVPSPEIFEKSGQAFGKFEDQMHDFPVSELYDTIPDFHHTPKRFLALDEAARKDAFGRLKNVSREMDFIMSQRDFSTIIVDALAQGAIPLRVAHNDTKINNVLFDCRTDEPLCILDLDTVMPGTSAMDFGDAIRFGASGTAEDEKDLSIVWMRMDLYQAYARGFLSACRHRLEKTEIELLPYGAKMITLENGVRFLADYLCGDIYYKTDYAEHNLDRCRTQLKLVADMNLKWDEMREI